jgi:GT2 family glycosyltransferase
MKTCAVTVTYGDRYHLLIRVIDALKREEIKRIIVVDNNSVENSKKQLRQIEKHLNGLLSVIYMEQNTGSAGGYKIGLQHARAFGDCHFIWLLDDDNEPEQDALTVLQSFWTENVNPGRESLTALVSYRDSRPEYKDLAMHQDSSLNTIIAEKNGFLGLNILNPISIAHRLHPRRAIKRKGICDMPPSSGSLPFAPYGGMFFSATLLDSIGYPDDRLYLYGDDLEFSYRITRSGGEIALVFDSRITDLNGDDHDKCAQGLVKDRLLRLYYKTRNLTHFRKLLVTKPFLYGLNKVIFMPMIFLGCALLSLFWQKKRTEIRIFLIALQDGLHDKLGIKDKIL